MIDFVLGQRLLILRSEGILRNLARGVVLFEAVGPE